MYVCCCKAVSDRAIRDAIAAGAGSVDAIAACTGAGTKCGTCRPDIARMIEAFDVAEGSLSRRPGGVRATDPESGGAPTADLEVEPAA